MAKKNGNGTIETINEVQLSNLYEFLTYDGKDKRSPRMILIADALGNSAKAMPALEGFYQSRADACTRYEDAAFREASVYFTHGSSNFTIQKAHIFSLLIEGVENSLIPLMSYLSRLFSKNIQQVKNKFSSRAERHQEFLTFIEVDPIDISHTQIGMVEGTYALGRDHVEQAVIKHRLEDVASLMVSIFFDFLMSEETDIKDSLDELQEIERIAFSVFAGDNEARSKELSGFNLRIRSNQDNKMIRSANRLLLKTNAPMDFHAKYDVSTGISFREEPKDALSFSRLNEMLSVAALRTGVSLPKLGFTNNRKDLRENLSFYLEMAKNPVDFLTNQPSIEGMSFSYFGELFERTFSELKDLRIKTMNPVAQSESTFSETEEVSRLEEEIRMLRQERTELQTKLFSLESTKSQLQEEKRISKDLQQEVKRLTHLLEQSANQDEEESLDETLESQDGDSNSLIPYDELQTIMKEMRIVIVGGHVNWQNKLSRVLPNIRFKDQSTYVDVDAIRNSDVVCFNTAFMQHKAFYETQEALRLRNVPVVFLDKTNVELTLRQIYEGYLKLK